MRHRRGKGTDQTVGPRTAKNAPRTASRRGYSAGTLAPVPSCARRSSCVKATMPAIVRAMMSPAARVATPTARRMPESSPIVTSQARTLGRGSPFAAIVSPIAWLGPVKSLRMPCGATRRPVTMRSNAIALEGFIAGIGRSGMAQLTMSAAKWSTQRSTKEAVVGVDQVDIRQHMPGERQENRRLKFVLDALGRGEFRTAPPQYAAHTDPGPGGLAGQRYLGSERKLDSRQLRESSVGIRGPQHAQVEGRRIDGQIEDRWTTAEVVAPAWDEERAERDPETQRTGHRDRAPQRVGVGDVHARGAEIKGAAQQSSSWSFAYQHRAGGERDIEIPVETPVHAVGELEARVLRLRRARASQQRQRDAESPAGGASSASKPSRHHSETAARMASRSSGAKMSRARVTVSPRSRPSKNETSPGLRAAPRGKTTASGSSSSEKGVSAAMSRPT